MGRKKIVHIAAIILGVILLIAVEYLIYKNRNLANKLEDLGNVNSTVTASITSTATSAPTTTAVATGAVKASASLTPSPVQSKSDKELIDQALASKFGTEVSNLDISISKKSDSAAYGTAGVKGEGGGWFVAVEDGSTWKIIANGNGIIDCALMDQYNVPNTVVAECYDSVTESTKIR